MAEADIEIVCYSPFLRFITFRPSPRKRLMVFAISVELVAKDYVHCECESAARQSGCCAKSCRTVQNGEKNILRDPVWHADHQVADVEAELGRNFAGQAFDFNFARDGFKDTALLLYACGFTEGVHRNLDAHDCR